MTLHEEVILFHYKRLFEKRGNIDEDHRMYKARQLAKEAESGFNRFDEDEANRIPIDPN